MFPCLTERHISILERSELISVQVFSPSKVSNWSPGNYGLAPQTFRPRTVYGGYCREYGQEGAPSK